MQLAAPWQRRAAVRAAAPRRPGPPLLPHRPPRRARRAAPLRAAPQPPGRGDAGGYDSDDSSDDGTLGGGYTGYSPNVFEAAPTPPANVGRKRQVAALIGGALLEFYLTGGVLWAPVMAALGVIALAPSRRQLQRREAEAVAQAEERVRIELLARQPVTPPESGQWVIRLCQALWRPWVEPFLIKTCLAQWQETISNAAPRGWSLAIADVSLGTEGPQLSDFQAYADSETGRLTAIDCRMAFNSDTLRVVVRGSSPIAAFTATVSGIRMTGELRMTPIMDQRMLLWAFKQAPSVNVKLAVKGPIGGADLSQFQFIQGIVASNIQELLVEPRRGVVPLDYEFRVEEAVATTVNLHVESLAGLPRTLGRRRAPVQLGVVCVETISRQRGATARPLEVSPGSKAVAVRETVKVELPRKEGMIRIELRDLSAGGRVLGSTLLWVSASMDGSTLFWGHQRNGEALARRWGPSDRPWRVSLPFEGDAVGGVAEVRLGVSVEPWTYKQPLVPAAYRSSGPHTVVLQIVEARNLGGPPPAPGAPAPRRPPPANPFVQLRYDQAAYATAVAYGTPSPVFLEPFAFAENSSMLTRRVRLEAWSAPPAGADAAAAAATGASVASLASSDGLPGRREYFGGTAINLDLTTEGAVQDRWYALGGGEGGEVRVRLAVVAGRPEEADAQEAADFFCGALGGASREALLVEVLSSRLQLPLSSMDSDDTDAQPVYRISYQGASVVGDTSPLAARRRSRAGRLNLRRRAPPPPARPGGARPGGGGGASGGGGGAEAAGADGADLMARAAFVYAPEPPPPPGAPGPRRPRWLDYSLQIECCDLDAAPGDEVMGSVEVDVAQRLALSDNGSWEGWLKLNKEGGHILVRLTRLPACEPADIILPPPRSAAAAAAAAATTSSADSVGASAEGATAAATAAGKGTPAAAPGPVGPQAAGGLARSGGNAGAAVSAVISGLAVDGVWLGQLVGRVQESQEGLRGQVSEQAQQAAAATNKWLQQATGWLDRRRGGRAGGEERAQPQKQPKALTAPADAAADAAPKPAAAPGGKSDGGSPSGLRTPSRGALPLGGAPRSGGSASGGFELQQALLSALGGLGIDGSRWGGGGAAAAKAAPLSSGWWDKVGEGQRRDGEQQGGKQQKASGQQRPEQQQGGSATEGPGGAGGGTGAAQPQPAGPGGGGPAAVAAAATAAAAAAVAPPTPATEHGTGGGSGGGDDASRLSSAMAAAAAAHARGALRQRRGAAAAAISSFPLQGAADDAGDGLRSFPLQGAAAEPAAAPPPSRLGPSVDEEDEDDWGGAGVGEDGSGGGAASGGGGGGQGGSGDGNGTTAAAGAGVAVAPDREA
ncbi:hypothetical protein Rsub_03129 [Raphidocelis subcapitata]|uniref:C2 domain-containing protein n=1 Tax=Raphidocelis subcapitata TaxID=307507 RepID=A0A2V0NSA9_9CHLO|nr:hypothetical protein Rsub_03129 [Raphidocelis subcapitata]|eukprot:GBF90558.1 hypothetical protein Rsub_03129 [Raphidocelis subcapitata]